MKLQMAPNSLFAVLLRQPWWMSMGIGLVLVMLCMALLPESWRVIGAMSTFPFWVIGAISAWRLRSVPGAAKVAQTSEAVSVMAWPAFSDLLEKAFQRDGFSVTRHGNGGQASAFDFELERKGRTMLVAARRWKSARTGLEVLRALQLAREQREAPDALLICLGGLTDNAVPFAAKHRIAVWQAPELAQALGSLLPRA